MELARSHMQVAIAQANQATDRRFAENRTNARKFAEILRTLAEVAEKVLADETTAETDANDPTIPVRYRTVECLAVIARPFEAVVKKFDEEHGDLVEESVRKTLQRFVEWAEARPGILRPAFQTYVKRYERGLEEAAASESATAAEWSVVDGDGLGEDAGHQT